MDSLSEKMTSCSACPRHCAVDRSAGKKGVCRAGMNPKVALASVHHWEEPCISGTKGSGTLFFSHCNMRCVFCQNFDISQEDFGEEIPVDELARMMLGQQEHAVHNINLVSPTQYLYQIRDALILARQGGLHIPVVYNSNGYENAADLKALNGLVDIYLPDIKYADNQLGRKYSGVSDYFEKASAAILEMVSQVGSPVFDDDGMMQKGVLIRHLILPGQLENTKQILHWISDNLPKDIYVSLMGQYTPMYNAPEYPELARRLRQREYDTIIDYFFYIGLENGFVQELSSAKDVYTPKFRPKEIKDTH
ncbi:radical SAM protein [Dehalobacter sp. DCM]|uniref:radical SAM protein n=1 Tax=Dehalobacter sp. DCM TaxID=2907827 RepID=UPI00308186E5|nr:radical SAM protein [Dehalobacter sp. DCM]